MACRHLLAFAYYFINWLFDFQNIKIFERFDPDPTFYIFLYLLYYFYTFHFDYVQISFKTYFQDYFSFVN